MIDILRASRLRPCPQQEAESNRTCLHQEDKWFQFIWPNPSQFLKHPARSLLAIAKVTHVIVVFRQSSALISNTGGRGRHTPLTVSQSPLATASPSFTAIQSI